MKQKENFLRKTFESAIAGVFAMFFSSVFLLPVIFLEEGMDMRGTLTSHYWFWLWAGGAGGFMFGRTTVESESKKKAS